MTHAAATPTSRAPHPPFLSLPVAAYRICTLLQYACVGPLCAAAAYLSRVRASRFRAVVYEVLFIVRLVCVCGLLGPCIYVCMYICMYICMYVYVCMYVYILCAAAAWLSRVRASRFRAVVYAVLFIVRLVCVNLPVCVYT